MFESRMKDLMLRNLLGDSHQMFHPRHFLTFLAGVISCTGVSAQCSKDTECKLDRVCEKGVCVAPRLQDKKATSSLSKSAASSEWLPETSIAVGKALQDQLGCKEKPEPGKALRALRARGVIDKPSLAIDGMNIFPTKRKFFVFGQRVLEVTGWESSPDKTLFWRGPGTAPSRHIVAIVEGDVENVKRSVAKVSGAKVSVTKTTLSNSKKPAVEIICYYDRRIHGPE